MNKKLLIGIASISFLLMTGCSNLDGITSSSSTRSPMSQERIATAVDINEEIFGIGSSTIEDSGQGVATMRANKTAREDLKSKLLKETQDILAAYLIEKDLYGTKISDKVISDLSEYVTNNMLNDAIVKDTWVENNKVYTVLSVERKDIPVKSRETFLTHLDNIITRLEELKAEIIAIPIEGYEDTTAQPVANTSPSVTEAKKETTTPLTEEADQEPQVDEADLGDKVDLGNDDDIIDVQL